MKAIPSFPGYFVDKVGNVYSTQHSKVPRLMATYQQSKHSFHRKVELRKDGRKVKCYVHTLVLITFVGPRPTGKVARHKNDIADDNRLQNLKWGSPENNRADIPKTEVQFKKFYAHCLRRYPQIVERFRALYLN